MGGWEDKICNKFATAFARTLAAKGGGGKLVRVLTYEHKPKQVSPPTIITGGYAAPKTKEEALAC